MKNHKDNELKPLTEVQAQSETAEKEKFYTNPWLIAVAAVLLVAIIVGMLVGIRMDSLSITLEDLFVDQYAREDLWAALLGKATERIDFMSADLSNYIEFDSEVYKNYEVSISVPPISEAEIEDDLINFLSSNRGSADGGYKYDLSSEIRPGDLVYLRYTAYEINDNGERTELSFINNLTVKDEELKTSGGLRVGALFGLGDRYFPGVESALVGVIPYNYQCDFAVSTGGGLLDGDNTHDVAYITATFIKEKDGRIYENYPIRIELDNEDDILKWGDGILEYLSEKQIGIANKDIITLNGVTKDKDGNETDERITFISTTVNYVTRGCEDDSVLTIETFFPYDYEDEQYRNRSFYIDVFFEGVTSYESPEWTDEFVTEKLGLKAEDLEACEGETLVEKFQNYRRKVLTSAREDAIKDASVDAVWEYLKSVIDVKKYPRREFVRIYEDYYYAVHASLAALQESGASYDSVDTYALDYFGLAEDANWYEHITNLANNEVKEKLIFYTIIKMENIIPTDEEFAALYRSELEKDFKHAYGKTEADFATKEEFESALESFRTGIVADKGEAFYIDAVYYYYATDTILSFATVKNVYGE